MKPVIVYDDRSKDKTRYEVVQVLSRYKGKIFALLDDGDVGVIDIEQGSFISEEKDCGYLVENLESLEVIGYKDYHNLVSLSILIQSWIREYQELHPEDNCVFGARKYVIGKVMVLSNGSANPDFISQLVNREQSCWKPGTMLPI